MKVPLRIVFRDIHPSLAGELEEEVSRLADRLYRYNPEIVSCRVVVERPHRRHLVGNLYRTGVVVSIPGRQIVVNREHPVNRSHRDLLVAIRHAFEDVARQIEEYALIQRRVVKDHDFLPHGIISRIFPEEGYGFITSLDGEDVYFHRNSVVNGFENLHVGMEVRFAGEEGEKGPQASTVKILRKDHAHHRGH